MNRRQSARIRLVASMVTLSLTAIVVPVRAAIAPFCAGERVRSEGQGSVSQAVVHASLFVPAYEAACTTAAGTVSFLGTGDQGAYSGAFFAARFRTNPFFGADAPLTTLQKVQLEGDTTSLRGQISQIDQIPIYVDGIDVGYNLGGCSLSHPLRLRQSVLGLIYSGAVRFFDENPLLIDNPELSSCHLAIKPGVRLDAAGITAVFKDYLSHESPAFAALKAPEFNTQWPATLVPGCGGLNDAAMATCLEVPGSIAYVEHSVAVARGVAAAAVDNGSGQLVLPASSSSELWPSGCVAAAGSAVIPPATTLDWSLVTLTTAPAGYPLCFFSYIWIFDRMRAAYASTVARPAAANTVDYIKTILGDGVQIRLQDKGLAPLPANVLAVSRAGIEGVSFT